MEKEIMACVRTESTTQGGLGKTSTEYAVAAVTPERMRRGSFGTTYDWAASIPLQDIADVGDCEKSEQCKIPRDAGLQTYGAIHGSSGRSQWYSGLGKDEAGDRFRSVLRGQVRSKIGPYVREKIPHMRDLPTIAGEPGRTHTRMINP